MWSKGFCILLGVGILLLLGGIAGLVAIIVIPYKNAYGNYKSGQCEVNNCRVSARYCGPYCYRGCVSVVCLDIIADVQLIDSAYINRLNETQLLYTTDLSMLNNGTALTCEKYVQNWNNSMKCYYDKRKLPSSIRFAKYEEDSGPFLGLVFMGTFVGSMVILVVFCVCAAYASRD